MDDTNQGGGKAAERPAISKADAAKWLKGKIKVRVPRLDSDGNPVKIAEGPDKGRFEVVERDPTAADILKAEESGAGITVVTVDGQKFNTAR